MPDEPLSYWVAVARMGFEDDFHRLFDELGISQAELARRIPVSEAYASKFLNGTTGNYELGTMVKWARAVGGIVQVRVIKEEGETVRIVDYQTARELDDKQAAAEPPPHVLAEVVVDIANYLPDAGEKRVQRMTLSRKLPLMAPIPIAPRLAGSHG